MGNELSRARAYALGSWAINFSTQIYGMVVKPNMKDIANAVCSITSASQRQTQRFWCPSQNHFAFSPNPYFIAAFFSGQTILQLYWIKSLFDISPQSLPNSEYERIQSSEGADSGAIKASQVSLHEKTEEQAAVKTTLDYVPIYAIGNLCIGMFT